MEQVETDKEMARKVVEGADTDKEMVQKVEGEKGTEEVVGRLKMVERAEEMVEEVVER